MIMLDCKGGGGGKNEQKYDYIICERSLIDRI